MSYDQQVTIHQVNLNKLQKSKQNGNCCRGKYLFPSPLFLSLVSESEGIPRIRWTLVPQKPDPQGCWMAGRMNGTWPIDDVITTRN